MQITIDETARRRAIQEKYNKEHNIVPTQINKKIVDVMDLAISESNSFKVPEEKRAKPISRAQWEQKTLSKRINAKDLTKRIETLEKSMKELALELKFEEAAAIRDEIADLRQALILLPGIDLSETD